MPAEAFEFEVRIDGRFARRERDTVLYLVVHKADFFSVAALFEAPRPAARYDDDGFGGGRCGRLAVGPMMPASDKVLEHGLALTPGSRICSSRM